jgi:hypothetical protein
MRINPRQAPPFHKLKTMNMKTIVLVICALLPVFLDTRAGKKHSAYFLLFGGLLIVGIAMLGFENPKSLS